MAAKKSTQNKQPKKNTLLDKMVLLGSSLAYLTKDTTDELIDVLDRNNIISTREGKATVEKMKAELQTRKDTVRKTVVSELGKVIDQLGIATKKDLEDLKKPARTKKKAQ